MPEAISTAKGSGRTLPRASVTRPIVEGNEQRWLFLFESGGQQSPEQISLERHQV